MAAYTARLAHVSLKNILSKDTKLWLTSFAKANKCMTLLMSQVNCLLRIERACMEFRGKNRGQCVQTVGLGLPGNSTHHAVTPWVLLELHHPRWDC